MTDTPAETDPSPVGVEESRAQVRRFEGRGMMLRAYDAATRALQEHPDDPWLKHRAVLALVRSDATETSRRSARGARPRGAEFGPHPMPVVP